MYTARHGCNLHGCKTPVVAMPDSLLQSRMTLPVRVFSTICVYSRTFATSGFFPSHAENRDEKYFALNPLIKIFWRFICSSSACGLIFLGIKNQNGKKYNKPYQIALNYTSIIHSKALQHVPKLGLWYANMYTLAK
jgi:hypothetical protein